MTKWGWFKLVSIFVLFLILVTVCIIEDRLVVTSLDQVNRFCYEIEAAVEENGGIVNGEVASLVDNLEYSWRENESKLCFLVNHKSVEELGIEIVRLKTYIDEEEPIEFYVSLDIIKHYVETYQHFMSANFHNIL